MWSWKFTQEHKNEDGVDEVEIFKDVAGVAWRR